MAGHVSELRLWGISTPVAHTRRVSDEGGVIQSYRVVISEVVDVRGVCTARRIVRNRLTATPEETAPFLLRSQTYLQLPVSFMTMGRGESQPCQVLQSSPSFVC
jgi:hypothetical protein